MISLLINLDRAPDRLKLIEEQFAAAGLSFERVAAVDAKAVPEAELRRECPPFRFYLANARRVRVGEIACLKSHQKCWRQAVASGATRTAVFEDDVLFDADSLKAAFAASEQEDDGGRPTVWLLQRGLRPGRPEPGAAWYDLLTIRGDIGHCWNGCGYIVNPAAARRLLELTTPMRNVNDAWSTFARCGIAVRAPVRPSCTQRNWALASSIERKEKSIWRFGWVRRFYWFRYRWAIRLDILLKHLGV